METLVEDQIRTQQKKVNSLLNKKGITLEVNEEAEVCRLWQKDQILSTFMYNTPDEALSWCYGVAQTVEAIR